MTFNSATASVRIAREIKVAEKALNAALVTQSQLLTTLVTARDQIAPDLLTGQDALIRLVRSQQYLLDAGNNLARVHGKLLSINKEFGGTAEDCPDDWRQVGQAELVAAA
jgi:hypothetical protein